MFEKALFIFRRDLRIQDNTGLMYAQENAKKVICFFIFTPEQIKQNQYKSDYCLQFMLESLEDLGEEIAKKGGRLFYAFDEPNKVITKCIDELKVDLIVVNRDFTPYSLKRDKNIEKLCKEKKITFKSCDDILLHPPETVLKADNTPYTVFTPFYKNACKMPVENPKKNLNTNYYHSPISFAKESSPFNHILPKRHLAQKGGRKEALKILNKKQNFSSYDEDRNYPYKDITTRLSPHLKFTTLSPREYFFEMRRKVALDHPLIKGLFWRDFFTSIAFYFPYVFKGAFHQKFDALKWEDNPSYFKCWCQGKTGFPIVDAGMRELNATGFMHNRVRMIVASFLVKDLHIDWQKGEKYFAQHLIDYDPAVNNGNWQWAASTGCDAQPYFRIFNPWAQQMKFDPDCLYIRKWIPELKDKSSEVIHKWHSEANPSNYPAPIIEHSKEVEKTLKYFKKC